MAAPFVIPFRKIRTLKNDRNDVEAIATAARQGNMRCVVPAKSVVQQARPAWHRISARATRLTPWALRCAALGQLAGA